MSKQGSHFVSRRRVLKSAAFIGAAALAPAHAITSPSEPKVTSMADELSPDEIMSLLELEPNATCGFVRVTFLSKKTIGAGARSGPRFTSW